MPKEIRNVFISHIHEDDHGLPGLKSLLEKNGMVARDYSITADKPNQAKSERYIKSEILAPQINACSTLVVYISPETKNSKWVDWEVEYAHKQGKRIVGVWERGKRDCEIPKALDLYGDALVGWNGENIIDAINGESDTWRRKDGLSMIGVTSNEYLVRMDAIPRLYSYIVARDYGFAPNPFYGFCTLATCKPRIRASAAIGDWIVGTGSKTKGRQGHLVYAMRVTETMSFDEYWNDARFQHKKPNLHGSQKQAFGDNIYHRDSSSGEWKQLDSHHSHKDGSPNPRNVKRDTSMNRILVSDDFIYCGGDGPLIPEFNGDGVWHITRGHRCKFPQDTIEAFIEWIRGIGDEGYCGDPLEWK